MPNMKQAVVDYLDSQEWKYTFDEEYQRYSLRMAAEFVDYFSLNIVVRDERSLRIYTSIPVRCDESKRGLVMEYLTRANYGLKVGNFEMDVTDGEVRYKVCTLYPEGGLTRSEVEYVVDLGMFMMERYGSDMMSVMYGGVSPADAIAKAEEA